MAIALVTNGTGLSTDSNGFTTGSFDTTGANFLIVGFVQSSATAGSGAISDSKSNTWLRLTEYTVAFSDRFIAIYYAENATVGSGHTFTAAGTSNFPTIIMAAFSGVATSSTFDVENGVNNTFDSTQPSGSITPGADNEFGHTAGATAYLIETTATAKNPTWTWSSGNARCGATVAAFKASGGVTTPITVFPRWWEGSFETEIVSYD